MWLVASTLDGSGLYLCQDRFGSLDSVLAGQACCFLGLFNEVSSPWLVGKSVSLTDIEL